MDEGVLESMGQDKSPEQDTPVQEQFFPQMDPEPEMGAAAAYDIPPPLLRQSPSPAPSETTTDNGGSVLLSPSVLAQMMEMFRQVMSGDMQQMKIGIDENAQQMEGINSKMDTNAKEIKEEMNGMNNKMEANTNGMREEMKEMRGEMRQMGQCLQAGKMATPRAGSSELGGVQRLSGPRWWRVKK